MEIGIRKADEVYRLLFNTAAEGLVITNADGVIDLCNPRLLGMFGYEDQNELIGNPIEVLVPDDLRKGHRPQRDQYLKDPKERPMGIGRTLKGRKKDGSTFPIEVSLNHFEWSGRRYVMGLVTDVSERRKIEDQISELNNELERKVQQRTAALRESQELYALIARNFPRGSIFVLDDDLTCVFAEGQDLLQKGVPSEALIGTSYTSRMENDMAEMAEGHLLKVLQGESHNFDMHTAEAVYNINAVPLFNRNRKISRVLIVERDVTQEHKYHEEIRKSLEKERELNELKSRFVSMASHEFRTPLATVLSSASLIERYQSTEDLEKRERHISRIKSSVNHLTNILNDFLSLSKLEEGRVIVNATAIDLNQFCDDIVLEVDGLRKPGQGIQCSHPSANAIFHTDENMLRNVLFNLLSNALKYSPENSNVELHCAIADDQLTISVRDHGIGIPESEQRNMFERFFRAKNATNIQGTGLGLNIVKRYIDLLDGNITFKSEEGEGTEFTVVLPRLMNDEEDPAN